MAFVPAELIAKAREMDLLTYLQYYDPNELVHVRGNVYCTRTHDSLKISNGKWMWWSRGIGGQSALDYLIKVENLPLPEAAERILGGGGIPSPPSAVPKQQEKPKPKTLLLPKACQSTTQAQHYLQQRGIASDIIDFCIQTNRLYESFPHHNLVFVGHDRRGKAQFAALRGIQSAFKGEANGSNKQYSFSIPAKDPSDTLHLFESAIDLLSYCTLLKLHGREWNREHLLSLAGVYQPNKILAESKIPIALVQYLEDFPQIQRIVLRLDNDNVGRNMAKALRVILPSSYTVEDKIPPMGKDYNDYLLHICLHRRQRKERNDAR